MKKFTFLFCVIIFTNNAIAQKYTNESFDGFKERFVLALWKQNPEWASSQGFHNYDSLLVVPNEASRVSGLLFCQ